MENLKCTKTGENLREAFLLEAEKSLEYHYFATMARREKMVQICELFGDASGQDLEHAKIWYKLLHGGVAGTGENLEHAVNAEKQAGQSAYAEYAKTAREEGFTEIAELFAGVAALEDKRAERWARLLENVREQKVFRREDPHSWMCSTCGNIHEGSEAPEVCPVCDHGRAYYRICPENF